MSLTSVPRQGFDVVGHATGRPSDL